MDIAELRAALFDKTPVILTHTDGHESEYKCVSAIIYRVESGRIVATAELLDCNSNSVVVCDPRKIRKGSAI